MKYTEFRKMVIEEYEEYLEFQNIKKQNAKEREEEVKRDIEEFDGPYIEGEIEKQWDEAYRAEWSVMFKILAELEKIGIDKSTGMLMLETKREKLRKLFAMA